MSKRKTRSELYAAGMFPVLLDGRVDSEGLACVPLALVQPHERQAHANHGQSLWTLASRGGLSPTELAAVLEDRDYKPMPSHDAWASIFRAAAPLRPNAKVQPGLCPAEKPK